MNEKQVSNIELVRPRFSLHQTEVRVPVLLRSSIVSLVFAHPLWLSMQVVSIQYEFVIHLHYFANKL